MCNNTTNVTTNCEGHGHEAIVTIVVVHCHHAGLYGEPEENAGPVQFSGGTRWRSCLRHSLV